MDLSHSETQAQNLSWFPQQKSTHNVAGPYSGPSRGYPMQYADGTQISSSQLFKGWMVLFTNHYPLVLVDCFYPMDSVIYGLDSTIKFGQITIH